MPQQFFIRVLIFFLLLSLALVLPACSPEPTPTLALPTATSTPTNPPTQVPTALPTPIPTAEPSCPEAAAGTQLLAREEMGYCLLYPEGYIEVDTDPAQVCLVPGEPYMMCHTANAFINVEDAA